MSTAIGGKRWGHLDLGASRCFVRARAVLAVVPGLRWSLPVRPPQDPAKRVWIDMAGGYQQLIRQSIPNAEIRFDPSCVVRVGQGAFDRVRRDEWNLPRPIPHQDRQAAQVHPLVALERAGRSRASTSSSSSAKSAKRTSRSTARSSSKTSCGSTTSTNSPGHSRPRRLARLRLEIPLSQQLHHRNDRGADPSCTAGTTLPPG